MTDTSDNTTLAALIGLLDEPDERAFNLIRGQILRMGADALRPLEKNLENTYNSIVTERTRDIIRQLHLNSTYSGFENWLSTGASDLLTGFLLVSRTRYPSLDESDILFRIEQMKLDIWIELNENLTALETIKVLNHLFYEIHHFDGNRNTMTAPLNNYINTLLETKLGSPLSLGMLYIILARKLQLPVFGVNLPQHFILAYLTSDDLESPGESDVLFYINPFNHGAVFTRREIELFVRQMKLKPDRSFFMPCSNTDIIRRLIHNLIFSYNQTGDQDRVEELEYLLTAMK
jgi:regulator of sirC expression with transglutaminase-like and TPR domain